MRKLIMGVAVCLGVFFVAAVNASEENLMAYWDFDEGTGSVVHDRSGNEIDGNIEGAVWVKNGKYGSAIEFSGHDVVNFGDTLHMGTNSFTIEAWVRQDEPSLDAGKGEKGRKIVTTGLVFSKLKALRTEPHYLGYGWVHYSTRYFILSDQNGAITTIRGKNPFPMKKWTHIAIVVDKDNRKVLYYQNGVLLTTNNLKLVEGSLDNNVDFTLGFCYFGGVNYYTKALVDEMAVFGRALTADEIEEHCAAGTARNVKLKARD